MNFKLAEAITDAMHGTAFKKRNAKGNVYTCTAFNKTKANATKPKRIVVAVGMEKMNEEEAEESQTDMGKIEKEWKQSKKWSFDFSTSLSLHLYFVQKRIITTTFSRPQFTIFSRVNEKAGE